MLIAILVRRKILQQGSHKTGEQPYFHGGPSIKVKQEKECRAKTKEKKQFCMAYKSSNNAINNGHVTQKQ